MEQFCLSSWDANLVDDTNWRKLACVYLHNYKNYEIILLSKEQAFSTLDIIGDQDEVRYMKVIINQHFAHLHNL